MDFIYNETIFFLLIFSRLSGVFLYTPFFSNTAITKKVRLGLILMITFLIFPAVTKNLVTIENLTFFTLASMVFREMLIGMIIGYFFLLMFSVVQTAAQIYSMDMGFGMVNILDPISQFQIPVLGQFKYLFLLSMFLLFGIHRKIIFLLIKTFEKYKLGDLTYNYSKISEYMIDSFSYYFMLSIKLALPILGVLFLTDVILGIMARIAPQMNVFFIGMPLKIMVGFSILIFFTPYFVSFLKFLLEDGVTRLMELIKISLSG